MTLSSISEEILAAERGTKKAALCLIIAAKGSTPREAGSKMLVYEDSSVFGSVGGGDLEKKVISNALAVIKEGKPAIFKHDLLHQHGMCCGGNVEIYIEPVMKKSRLYIFGAGHIGKALAEITGRLGFDIFIIDERKDYIDKITLPDVYKLNLELNASLSSLKFDENAYIVIVTYDHQVDRDILSYCLKKPHAYIGMIGSRRKAEVTKKMFIESGVCSADELQDVHMPIGESIGAETPEEIAVSIAAELIKVKNKKTIEK